MWPKRTEVGYCSLHCCELTRRQVHEKCSNPHRRGCYDGKRCKYLCFLRKVKTDGNSCDAGRN